MDGIVAKQLLVLRTTFLQLLNQSEATCLNEVGFDPNKAPKNLLGNEPSLSAQGTGGICGKSISPLGSTIASGIILPGNRARKTLFIPPSSPL
jgi:hypothetical protein